ncbi:MAG: amidohydrolase [Thermomicrobiales bacterium]|nr:amidohydrolase [Thermomicrobiales bacterium]
MTTRDYATIDLSVDRTGEAMESINKEVWMLAEISNEESESAKVHMRELEAAGFTITSVGTSGRPTAFIAEWEQGEGGARIGFLPEYDALPDLGNAASGEQVAAPNGKTSGHGCGHNLLGAACTGAAIALKFTMEMEGIPGLVRVYGCAAEETSGAKVYMVRDGYFDDIDVCIAWHPQTYAGTGYVSTSAMSDVVVEFHGKTAHAGGSPWEGRSALDALELFMHGINLMREHVPTSVRMHYVIQAGGSAPNIVPDYTRLYMYLRDKDRAGVEALTTWARALAEGAAMGTQTRAEFHVPYGMSETINNTPLVENCYKHMMEVGAPQWTEAEQAFARDCQRNFGVPEEGMATDVRPISPPSVQGGSSDLGDVSWCVPLIWFWYPSVPQGVSMHTWPVTACGGMSIGSKAVDGAAKIMARMGYDLMTDAELRAAARADFIERRGDVKYISPLDNVS